MEFQIELLFLHQFLHGHSFYGLDLYPIDAGLQVADIQVVVLVRRCMQIERRCMQRLYGAANGICNNNRNDIGICIQGNCFFGSVGVEGKGGVGNQ